ncbi:MAG: hypothetical protein L0H96_25660 [Humibacillus sp.]|nr:hypothetical protein [Humibacillus sp.]MDN5780264.1 hypothetical protein [Humibacillus sp.]
MRPLVAVGTAAGVAFGVLGLTASVSAGQGNAVDLSVAMVSHTDVLARDAVMDTATQAQQRVSRDVTRVALSATAVQKAKAAVTQAAAAKRAQAAAAARAREAAAQKKRVAVIAGAKADPRSAARVLMSDHGWSGDAQYGCLVNLWNGESGWQWSAQNSSSGAYGIPQSLPAGKMAQFGNDYRTNPITQMKWGLWYIENSYGSPCAAWSTWQSRSPHWY